MFRHRPPAAAFSCGEHSSGFALAEALVALGVLVLVVVLGQATFASGWRTQNRAGNENGAVALARAQLTAAGIETPLRDSTTSGSDGRYDWRIDVTRYEMPARSTAKPRLAAWWVNVEVSFVDHGSPAARSVRLKTLKFSGTAP